jgi:ribosomal protein L2
LNKDQLGVAMNQSITPLGGGGEGKKSGKGLSPLGKPNNRGKTTNSKTN